MIIIDTKEKLITKYNQLIDNIDKTKPTIETLSRFTGDDWIIFIAGKTLAYGRSFEASLDNAFCQVNDGENLNKTLKKLTKLWGYKDEE